VVARASAASTHRDSYLLGQEVVRGANGGLPDLNELCPFLASDAVHAFP